MVSGLLFFALIRVIRGIFRGYSHYSRDAFLYSEPGSHSGGDLVMREAVVEGALTGKRVLPGAREGRAPVAVAAAAAIHSVISSCA